MKREKLHLQSALSNSVLADSFSLSAFTFMHLADAFIQGLLI